MNAGFVFLGSLLVRELLDYGRFQPLAEANVHLLIILIHFPHETKACCTEECMSNGGNAEALPLEAIKIKPLRQSML